MENKTRCWTKRAHTTDDCITFVLKHMSKCCSFRHNSKTQDLCAGGDSIRRNWMESERKRAKFRRRSPNARKKNNFSVSGFRFGSILSHIADQFELVHLLQFNEKPWNQQYEHRPLLHWNCVQPKRFQIVTLWTNENQWPTRTSLVFVP